MKIYVTLSLRPPDPIALFSASACDACAVACSTSSEFEPVIDTPPRPNRSRADCIALALATVVLGLATRRYPMAFPSVVATYGGDALWAALVFWLLTFAQPRAESRHVGVVALGISIAVEVSQLYRAPWIDAVRGTTLGALVLGQGFLWSDLVCYVAGVGVAVLIDQLVVSRSRR